MNERMRFVLAVIEEPLESMSALCARFEISRKTGYKWLDRFERGGPAALEDRSPCALTIRHRLPEAMVMQILELKKEHPFWGPKKIQAVLKPGHGHRRPATSTIGALLKAYGLVKLRRRRPVRNQLSEAPFPSAPQPNDVWCADFKGHFRLGDGQRCDPFTMTDLASRYLLKCEALGKTDAAHVRPHLERAFREYGLPLRFRSDNGVPFASAGLGRLSTLSVWLIKLGIHLERIDPGHPEQNGQHERMHRTLKAEVRPQEDLAAEQRALDRFRAIFNELRPHEGLAQRTPAQVYQRSSREMQLLDLAGVSRRNDGEKARRRWPHSMERSSHQGGNRSGERTGGTRAGTRARLAHLLLLHRLGRHRR